MIMLGKMALRVYDNGLFESCYKTDDKPSAALDPYIPTWCVTTDLFRLPECVNMDLIEILFLLKYNNRG